MDNAAVLDRAMSLKDWGQRDRYCYFLIKKKEEKRELNKFVRSICSRFTQFTVGFL